MCGDRCVSGQCATWCCRRIDGGVSGSWEDMMR